MRGNLTFIHPRYLDNKSLVWAWKTGINYYRAFVSPFGKNRIFIHYSSVQCIYKSHNPRVAMANYLYHIWDEAAKRGLNFNIKLLYRGKPDLTSKITIEIDGEKVVSCAYNAVANLLARRKEEAIERYTCLINEQVLQIHPLFYVGKNSGYLEDWWKKYEERTSTSTADVSISGTYNNYAANRIDMGSQEGSYIGYYIATTTEGSPSADIERAPREWEVNVGCTIASNSCQVWPTAL